MNKIIIFLVVGFIVVLSSCEKTPTEPTVQSEKTPYMTLNVGGIHQYKDDVNNVSFQWEIVDTTKRSDDRKVFIIEESIIDNYGIMWKGINYYFINNLFFIRC